MPVTEVLSYLVRKVWSRAVYPRSFPSGHAKLSKFLYHQIVSTLEANLEAVEAAAFEADLELISHMNNNPSLFIVFSDLKVCDSAACRYSFLQVFDSTGVHFF